MPPVFFNYNRLYQEGLNNADTEKSCRTEKKTRKYLFFTKTEETQYQSGFHFWQRKKDALKYKKSVFRNKDHICHMEIIECQINKKDITAVGKETMFSKGIVFVTDKAIFPKYKKE